MSHLIDRFLHSRAAFKNRWAWSLVSICMIGLPLSASVALGYALGYQQSNVPDQELEVDAPPSEKLAAAELLLLQQKMEQLEARVGKLDAIGERVADMAQVELDTIPATPKLPAIGVPTHAEAVPPQRQDIYATIDRLVDRIDEREAQFDNLQILLTSRARGDRALFGAQPVLRSDISSYFGMRIDPVTGARSMHQGIDFPGKSGTAIMAAADGVVTFAGDRQGYGRLIEINHGDDVFTRYAHSKLFFVRSGDIV